MAETERRRLTRGQAALLSRLSGLIGVLLLLGGILTILAPLPESLAPNEIAKAVAPRPEPRAAVFPRYDELTSERADPFELGELRRVEVSFAPLASESGRDQTGEASPPPPPQPDTDQLELVGTAPGSRRGFAVFADRRNGLTFVVAQGQPVRNAVLKAVLPDRAVLALGQEESAIGLTPVPGSEAWRPGSGSQY